ncbi:MAG TPA: hypothetical protein VJ343_01500 [archaeon]|nr:hypothetical protein [archaeon]
MREYKMSGKDIIRKFLEKDGRIYKFLEYMGLFTAEIKNYLMANGMVASKDLNLRSLLQHKNANVLSTKIAGNRFQVIYRAICGESSRRRKACPGECIYYHGDFFGDFSGYPRIIYEVLDSSVRFNPVNLLSAAAEKGSARVRDFYSMFPGNAFSCARKLSNLGFLSFDGKSKILTPTAASIKIFSPKVKEVFEELKKWEYRIDVWG